LCVGTLLGAGASLSKRLVSRTDPMALAGALYGGAALGLTAATVLVVGHDDQRCSLAWETVER
jgi:hypothetical protein